MIRIGIIGLGFMGRTHYEAYQKIPDARVVRVFDRNPKRAGGDLSGGWGNLGTGAVQQLPMDQIRGTTDWRELVESADVDIVDICAATPAHVEMTLAALAAGKHVLCEKPLALSAAGARKIAQAAATARGYFMPAMCLRFWPEWEFLKRAIDEQTFGRVRSAVFRRLGSMPAGWFREGNLSGGALFDLHVHDTDFIYHVFGKPRGVFSRGYSKTSGEIDHVLTHYLYENDALIAAEGGWCLADGRAFNMSYIVNFEEATLEYDLARSPTLAICQGGETRPIAVSAPDGFVGELRYFLSCIASSTPPRRVTAEDAVAGMQILEAEQQSILSGAISAV